MNRFNQMCSTVRRTLNKTRKGTQVKFYKAVVVPTLTYMPEVWTVLKKNKSKIGNCRNEIL
jgi:hypothetical protein